MLRRHARWLRGGLTRIALLRLEATNGLLGVHSWWQILVLMEPLSHALKGIWRHLPHASHVCFLLCSLFLSSDGVKRTGLLRKGRD